MFDVFEKLKMLSRELIEVLGLVLVVAILVSALFGPEVPFFGGIMANVQGMVDALGSSGLGVVVALLILYFWSRR